MAPSETAGRPSQVHLVLRQQSSLQTDISFCSLQQQSTKFNLDLLLAVPLKDMVNLMHPQQLS